MSKKDHSKGKSKIHYIPAEAILAMGHAFAMGAEKHGPYSFRDEPIEYTELIDSLMRHTLAFLDGEDLDPESGLPHTFHMLANGAMLEWTRVNAPEKDDRPKKVKKVLVKDYDNEEPINWGNFNKNNHNIDHFGNSFSPKRASKLLKKINRKKKNAAKSKKTNS